ncbi:MAG: transposase, partial [Verrucomicrobiales bacterium]|nr:transposase [Verrucomicrobiales bacterium]
MTVTRDFGQGGWVTALGGRIGSAVHEKCLFQRHSSQTPPERPGAASRQDSGFSRDTGAATNSHHHPNHTQVYRQSRVDETTVAFRWTNRDAGRRQETCTLTGVEFVKRYLRHVLPRGLRSIRSYGFCHPAARAKRIRIQCHAGGPVQFGAS